MNSLNYFTVYRYSTQPSNIFSIVTVNFIGILSIILLLIVKLLFDLTLPLNFAIIILTVSYNTILRACIIDICLMILTYYLLVLGLNIFDIITMHESILLMLENNSGGTGSGGGSNGNSGPSNNMPGGPHNDSSGALVGGAGSQNSEETNINEYGNHFIDTLQQGKNELQITNRLSNLKTTIENQIYRASSNHLRESSLDRARGCIKEYIQVTQASFSNTHKDALYEIRIDKAKKWHDEVERLSQSP